MPAPRAIWPAHKVLALKGLNVYDVLNYDELLMTAGSARAMEQRLGGGGAMNQESLILGPCVTEKGTAASEQANQVVFRVQRHASKGAIRQAVERLLQGYGGQGQDRELARQEADAWDGSSASVRTGRRLTSRSKRAIGSNFSRAL